VLLALSVFMLLIAENTPATSFFIPLLGTMFLHSIITCTHLLLFIESKALSRHRSRRGRDS
jgi:hypothetical protein